MYDVVTIGSATRDMMIEGKFPIIPWKEVPSGKAYALPRGEKLEISKIYFTLGGNGANAAVTLRKQGLRTACVAKVGDDVSGHEAIRGLRAAGVDARHVAIDKKKPTSDSILILEDGERTILNYRGASNGFTLHDVPLEKLAARWWYISLPGESDVMFPELVKFAKQHQIKIAFNPSGHHLHHRKHDILRALPSISFLVMNDEEASWLTDIDFAKPHDIMRRVAGEMKGGIFAMTLGPKGVLVTDGTYLYRAGIFKEKKIADRTGAGDSFGAGFVAGLMHRDHHGYRRWLKGRKKAFTQDDIIYAIRLASANATANVERLGATEGTLTRTQFERDSRWKKFPVKVSQL